VFTGILPFFELASQERMISNEGPFRLADFEARLCATAGFGV
jgi:hypothetical protein